MDTKLDCEVDAEAAADMVVRGEEIQSTPRSARFAPAKVNLPKLTVKPFFRPKAVGRGHSVGLREVLSRVLYKILPRTSRPGHDVPVMMSSTRNPRPGCSGTQFSTHFLFGPHALPPTTQHPTIHLKNIEQESYNAAPANQNAAEAA